MGTTSGVWIQDGTSLVMSRATKIVRAYIRLIGVFIDTQTVFVSLQACTRPSVQTELDLYTVSDEKKNEVHLSNGESNPDPQGENLVS